MSDETGSYFEDKIITVCVQWYLQYPLSYRQIQEMLVERGLDVHHSTLNRWVVRFSEQIKKKTKIGQGPETGQWTLDESHVKIKGDWKYLYQAIGSKGQTLDFVLMEKKNGKAAKLFLQQALSKHVWCAVPASLGEGTKRTRAR
jgi:putative transposase